MVRVLKNFYVLEGIDGSGTTTQINLLQDIHKNSDIPFYKSCEPTDSPIGKFIRDVLKGKYKFDDMTIASLFSADRNEHIFGEAGIKKKCEEKIRCFSDRYFFSSLAYQSNRVEIKKIYQLNNYFPLPEILFFIDINPKDAITRVENRDGEKEIYENIDYLNFVRDQYLKILEKYKYSKMKIVKIDGLSKIEEINKIICSNLYYLKK